MGKNILICLEKLNIGGVETAVFNYALSMKKQGNNVGRNIQDAQIEDICKEIFELSNNKEKINEIVEGNYKYIKEQLDVNKNVYYITENDKENIEDIDITNELLSVIQVLQKEIENKRNEAEKIWKAKLYLERKNSEIKQQNNKLKNELDNINVSKKYKKMRKNNK